MNPRKTLNPYLVAEAELARAEQLARARQALPQGALSSGGAGSSGRAVGAGEGEDEQPQAFRSFSASELYCPTCRRSMPVRERMLLVLPGGDLYEYVCTRCSSSLGTKTT